jgi:Chaperone of endosialidase
LSPLGSSPPPDPRSHKSKQAGKKKGRTMNPLFELKKTAPLLLIILTLLCFGLLPKVLAVVPPPDGGYPGFNTAEGQNALFSLTTGTGNTAVGAFSLFSVTEGSFNTATGAGALLRNTTGELNTAFGAAALLNNTTGLRNTAIGDRALENNIAGTSNTAVGDRTLASNTTGDVNIALGPLAGFNVSTASNVICIGDFGANVSESCYIGNIYGTAIDPATTLAVGMDASHRLGTAVSSERFKRDIQPMGKASEAVLALKPVMFHYKSDARNTPCFGLVAEHVAEVNPHLVVSDEEGKPLAVRYDQVNAMLLHEFQKEHRRNEEQEATIARLIGTDKRQQKQIEALTAALQKVSAQLELRKHARQVVDNE